MIKWLLKKIFEKPATSKEKILEEINKSKKLKKYLLKKRGKDYEKNS